MTTTIAVIGAGPRSTHAVLAAEALRRAQAPAAVRRLLLEPLALAA